MFAYEPNIIPFFETICSVDQGTDINPKAQAALRIVKNAMESRKDESKAYQYMDMMELKLLNGAQIDLGLYGNEFYIYQTYGINSYGFNREGAEIVIDYLADKFKEYFWYAQREINTQEKSKKRTRRSRKTT